MHLKNKKQTNYAYHSRNHYFRPFKIFNFFMRTETPNPNLFQFFWEPEPWNLNPFFSKGPDHLIKYVFFRKMNTMCMVYRSHRTNGTCKFVLLYCCEWIILWFWNSNIKNDFEVFFEELRKGSSPNLNIKLDKIRVKKWLSDFVYFVTWRNEITLETRKLFRKDVCSFEIELVFRFFRRLGIKIIWGISDTIYQYF